MPLNGSGAYTPPSPEFPAVGGTTILASDFNAIINDIKSALDKAFYRDGQASMEAAIAMGGFKITGLGEATMAGDAVRFEQLPTAAAILTALKTVDGTGSLLDADLLDGKEASEFATADQGTIAENAYELAEEAYALAEGGGGGLTTASQTCVIGAESAGSLQEIALNPALRITGGVLTPSHSIYITYPGSFILLNPAAGHDPATDYGGTWEKRSVTWGSYAPSCDLWFRIA